MLLTGTIHDAQDIFKQIGQKEPWCMTLIMVSCQQNHDEVQDMLYNREFFDVTPDVSVKLINRLGRADAERLHAALDNSKLSMFGHAQDPVSDVIRTAVVMQARNLSECYVTLVTSNGQLISFTVPFNEDDVITNRSTLLAADREVRRLMAGEDPLLDVAKFDPVQSLNHFSSVYRAGTMDMIGRALNRNMDFDNPGNGYQSHQIITGILKKRNGACRKSLLQALDPDVRLPMDRSLTHDTAVACLLTGANDMRYSPDWRERKAKAMRVAERYPAFITLLRDRYSALWKVINDGSDPTGCIAQETGLNTEQVEALTGKTAQAIISVQGSIRIPGRTRREIWQMYRRFSADALRDFKPRLLVNIDNLIDNTTLAQLPGQTALRTRFLKETREVPETLDLLKSKKVDIRHVKEYLTFLERKIKIPLDILDSKDRAPNDPALYHVLMPRSLKGILEATEYFHDHDRFDQRKFKETIDGHEQDITWAPLIEDVTDGEHTITHLTAIKDLAGPSPLTASPAFRALRTYGEGFLMFAKVKVEGEMDSWAEMEVSNHGITTVKTRDHRSMDGQKADEAHQKALQAFVTKIEARSAYEIRVHTQLLRDTQNDFNVRQNSGAVSLDALEKVWDMCAPMLSREAQKLGSFSACVGSCKEERVPDIRMMVA